MKKVTLILMFALFGAVAYAQGIATYETGAILNKPVKNVLVIWDYHTLVVRADGQLLRPMTVTGGKMNADGGTFVTECGKTVTISPNKVTVADHHGLILMTFERVRLW
jgi:hypothetical protein